MSTRALFPAGGAFIIAGGITIELAADWKAETQIVTVPMDTNLHGVTGESEDYVVTKITGKPIATSTNLAALKAFLQPYDPTMIGQCIFPSTDRPLVIQTRDGQGLTYAAFAVSKMADANFAANVDIFGEFEITCLRAGGADPTSLDDFANVDDSTYTAPLTYPLARIRSPYTVAWGSVAPFNAIETDKTGVKFSPTLKLDPVETMLGGVVNWRIAEVGGTAKFVPRNLDIDDFLAFVQAQAASAGVGSVVGQRGQALTVTSTKIGDPVFTMPLAVPVQGPLGFDNKSRVGEVTLNAQRKSTSGVLSLPWTIGVRAS